MSRAFPRIRIVDLFEIHISGEIVHTSIRFTSGHTVEWGLTLLECIPVIYCTNITANSI
jgi:hypothetical protein